jgi:hypothetical protein
MEPLIIEGILTTDKIDSEGEMIAYSSLHDIARSANESIIPLGGYAHDPRNPPQGRVISAEVIKTDEGWNAVRASIEIFQKDVQPLDFSNRVVVRKYTLSASPSLVADNSFDSEEEQALINELCQILNIDTPQREIKKGVSVVSILEAFGLLILFKFSEGFFSEAGKDAYRSLKNVLKKIFSKHHSKKRDIVYSYRRGVCK